MKVLASLKIDGAATLSFERLLSSKDFERVLTRSSLVRKGRFALHFLAECPSSNSPSQRLEVAGVPAITPDSTQAGAASKHANAVFEEPKCVYLGLVVPKRHARRSVMRSLIKRKIRTVFGAAAHRLPRGMWVVRLTKPFSAAEFTSAQSEKLRQTLQLELEAVIEHCFARIQKRTPGT
jgi:ribonuclease P protein component